MLRSHIGWLIPLALTCFGFGSNVERAIAQTSNEFSVTYDTEFLLTPRSDLGENIFRATITGTSSDAAFELSNFTSNTYGKLLESTPTIQKYQFDADPGVFGLENQPILGDRYFGGSNELFGRASDMATIDFANQKVSGGGTITLTGGTGLFENATGQITFTQEDELDPNAPPGTPVKGQAKLNFSVQTPAQQVPEPSATTTLVGIGVIGAGLLVRRQLKMGSRE